MFARLPQRRLHLALVCLGVVAILFLTQEVLRRYHEYQKFYRFQDYASRVEGLRKEMSMLEASARQLENRTADVKLDLLIGRKRSRYKDTSRLAAH